MRNQLKTFIVLVIFTRVGEPCGQRVEEEEEEQSTTAIVGTDDFFDKCKKSCQPDLTTIDTTFDCKAIATKTQEVDWECSDKCFFKAKSKKCVSRKNFPHVPRPKPRGKKNSKKNHKKSKKHKKKKKNSSAIAIVVNLYILLLTSLLSIVFL